jgi:post-segregation antitoxin (ccd killing protein)
MPAATSIVVSKPHVTFAQRLTDRQLQRLTVAQLRKQARTAGLDVSRLTDN